MSEQQRSSPGTSSLLPCPFCGKSPNLNVIHENDDGSGPVEFAYVYCSCGTKHSERISESEAEQAWNRRDGAAQGPKVSVKPMQLSDNRTDYFVSVSVGDREITPYVFRDEQFKAEYEAASFRWLLLGEPKPDLMAYSDSGWPTSPSVSSTTRGTPKIVGRVTGIEYDGDQVPGMPGAICHACGLKSYPCTNPDCPKGSEIPPAQGNTP